MGTTCSQTEVSKQKSPESNQLLTHRPPETHSSSEPTPTPATVQPKMPMYPPPDPPRPSTIPETSVMLPSVPYPQPPAVSQPSWMAPTLRPPPMVPPPPMAPSVRSEATSQPLPPAPAPAFQAAKLSVVPTAPSEDSPSAKLPVVPTAPTEDSPSEKLPVVPTAPSEDSPSAKLPVVPSAPPEDTSHPLPPAPASQAIQLPVIDTPEWVVGQTIHYFAPQGWWTRGQIVVIAPMGGSSGARAGAGGAVDDEEKDEERTVEVLDFRDGKVYSTHYSSPTLRRLEEELPWGEPYYDFEGKTVSDHLIAYSCADKNRGLKVSEGTYLKQSEQFLFCNPRCAGDQINDYRWKYPTAYSEEAQRDPPPYRVTEEYWVYISHLLGNSQEMGGWRKVRIILMGPRMGRILFWDTFWGSLYLPMRQMRKYLWKEPPATQLGRAVLYGGFPGRINDQKGEKVRMYLQGRQVWIPTGALISDWPEKARQIMYGEEEVEKEFKWE